MTINTDYTAVRVMVDVRLHGTLDAAQKLAAAIAKECDYIDDMMRSVDRFGAAGAAANVDQCIYAQDRANVALRGLLYVDQYVGELRDDSSVETEEEEHASEIASMYIAGARAIKACSDIVDKIRAMAAAYKPVKEKLYCIQVGDMGVYDTNTTTKRKAIVMAHAACRDPRNDGLQVQIQKILAVDGQYEDDIDDPIIIRDGECH